MVVKRVCQCWPMLLALMVGCSGSTATSPAQEEGKVKAAFESVQKALLAHDTEKLWGLLDSDTQADTERAAKAWKDAYAKADADKVKKDLGISMEELAKLTGKGFLKTGPFNDKELEELAESKKIENVKVEGEQATVEYVEPNGEKEKLKFVRQEGQWKVRLPVPKPKS